MTKPKFPQQSKSPWYKSHWRRLLMDAHIQDWDGRFLAKWEPKTFAENLARAHVSAAMIYANSHVGLCYWPTKTGAMHRSLKGRDITGECIAECRKRGMAVVAYYSLIFNNWAFVNHPDWRIVPAGEKRWSPRYGVVCPNSPGYRDFAVAQVEELFGSYKWDSVFFDMTFWPDLCVCPDCIKRCVEELGHEPLRAPDWDSPQWMRFQRWREDCIIDFARLITEATKRTSPKTTVTHQFSTVLYDWGNGVPFRLADSCDYLSGDFYGDPIQQSIACKAYHAISNNHCYEFMTTANISLFDHVSLKPKERLRAHTALALAHHTPFVMIDAVNPDGTQNPATYELIGEVFSEIERYEPHLGGTPRADVGVYFSQDCKFAPARTTSAGTFKTDEALPHFQAMRGACRALQREHIPFGIVTRRNLNELDQYQVLVLPDVLLMDEEECAAIRNFVQNGGGLYASCRSSSRCQSGEALPDFLLSDLFGAALLDEVDGTLIFMKPTDAALQQTLAPQNYLIHKGFALNVHPAGAQPLATRTLPWTDPAKGNEHGGFTSIHSNPPGPDGHEPALLLNNFGRGKVIYSTAAIEGTEQDINVHIFAGLIRRLLSKPLWFQADAHPSVEITYFDQPEHKRALLSVVVNQPEFPQLPVEVTLRARLADGLKAKEAYLLPDKKPLKFASKKGFVEIRLNKVDTLAMLAIAH